MGAARCSVYLIYRIAVTNQAGIVRQCGTDIVPVTDREQTADQEISETLDKLGARQLGQEEPGHRLQLFLQQDDQQNNAEYRIQNGCASACNHNPVKNRHACVIRRN